MTWLWLLAVLEAPALAKKQKVPAANERPKHDSQSHSDSVDRWRAISEARIPKITLAPIDPSVTTIPLIPSMTILASNRILLLAIAMRATAQVDFGLRVRVSGIGLSSLRSCETKLRPVSTPSPLIASRGWGAPHSSPKPKSSSSEVEMSKKSGWKFG